MNLSRLIGRLDALSAGSFLDGIKRDVALGGLRLTAQCFRTSTDPYGVRWPGLKTPRPGGPVEVKTGAMRDGAIAGPHPEGVRFAFAAPYAKFQHWGTAKNPQRRLLPVGWLGVPAPWQQMIEKSYTTAARKALP